MRLMPPILMLLFALACFAGVACDGYGDDAEGDATTSVTPGWSAIETSEAGLLVVDLRYDGGVLRVELAETPDDRSQGLGGRDALAEGTGMLFDLGETRVPGFWMKDMRFALDMVWIDEEMRIVGVSNDVQPQPDVPDGELRRYSPQEPVRYVLEINAGAATRLGLAAGERVEW